MAGPDGRGAGSGAPHGTHGRPGFPVLRQVVLDTTDARRLAEFYRALLGLEYRVGDEPPDGDDERGRDWLVLVDASGSPVIAAQQVERLPRSTWPDHALPQQIHLDLTVPSVEALDAQHARVLDLGGRLLLDRAQDPEEPLRVYADVSGHPFCIFVAGDERATPGAAGVAGDKSGERSGS